MKIKYLLIAQFLAWAAFTVVDFIEERTSIDVQLLQGICLCTTPIIIAVLYFIKKEKGQPLKQQIKRLAIWVVIWSFLTIVSTSIIFTLVFYDMWIVPQLGYMFDGLEYAIFGVFLLFIPIELILVGEFLTLMVIKCSAYLRKKRG